VIRNVLTFVILSLLPRAAAQMIVYRRPRIQVIPGCPAKYAHGPNSPGGGTRERLEEAHLHIDIVTSGVRIGGKPHVLWRQEASASARSRAGQRGLPARSLQAKAALGNAGPMPTVAVTIGAPAETLGAAPAKRRIPWKR